MRYCRQVRIIDIPSARTLRARVGLTAPCQPCRPRSPCHPARAITPCPKDSPAGTVSSSPQPCPAHPWDFLNWAVSSFWPRPVTIPKEVPNPEHGGCSWCSQLFCSRLDRAGTQLGLDCLMEIPMEGHRESQVLSKVLEWGYADPFNQDSAFMLLHLCAGTYLFAYTLWQCDEQRYIFLRPEKKRAYVKEIVAVLRL